MVDKFAKIMCLHVLPTALKKCRCGADTLLTLKQKERWRKEVEIMQRLNHPNVVRAISLPEDLAKLPSILPILCMEYCSKGDLRQVCHPFSPVYLLITQSCLTSVVFSLSSLQKKLCGREKSNFD